MRPLFYAVATFVAGIIAAVAVVYTLGGFGSAKADPTPTRPVTDVKSGQPGPVYATTRTFLCVESSGTVARDWNFVDRWVMPQLTYDTYTVNGRTYDAFRIVTDDPTLPERGVRFREVIVDIGTGPTLEGHTYLRTLINDKAAKMEQKLLFVEFNGRLERQRRPLPACGTPRS